jgi:hypothetical protein
MGITRSAGRLGSGKPAKTAHPGRTGRDPARPSRPCPSRRPAGTMELPAGLGLWCIFLDGCGGGSPGCCGCGCFGGFADSAGLFSLACFSWGDGSVCSVAGVPPDVPGPVKILVDWGFAVDRVHGVPPIHQQARIHHQNAASPGKTSHDGPSRRPPPPRARLNPRAGQPGHQHAPRRIAEIDPAQAPRPAPAARPAHPRQGHRPDHPRPRPAHRHPRRLPRPRRPLFLCILPQPSPLNDAACRPRDHDKRSAARRACVTRVPSVQR